MKNLLAKLESNEVILLMYLAGELHAEDHADLTHQLQVDASLRAELANLEASLHAVDEHFRQADQKASLNIARAVQHTTQAMHQWQANPAARLASHAASQDNNLPLPWWMYPLAAAASIILAFAVWVTNREPVLMNSPHNGNMMIVRVPDWSDSQAAIQDPNSLAFDDAQSRHDAEVLVATLDDSDQVLSDAMAKSSLARASSELATIEQLSEEMGWQ